MTILKRIEDNAKSKNQVRWVSQIRALTKDDLVDVVKALMEEVLDLDNRLKALEK